MKLQLDDGRAVLVCEPRGEFTTLHSDVSFPPGSTLALRSEHLSQPYQVKVRSCRRDSETGVFVIEGRWVNLSRRQREVLEGVSRG